MPDTTRHSSWRTMGVRFNTSLVRASHNTNHSLTSDGSVRIDGLLAAVWVYISWHGRMAVVMSSIGSTWIFCHIQPFLALSSKIIPKNAWKSLSRGCFFTSKLLDLTRKWLGAQKDPRILFGSLVVFLKQYTHYSYSRHVYHIGGDKRRARATRVVVTINNQTIVFDREDMFFSREKQWRTRVVNNHQCGEAKRFAQRNSTGFFLSFAQKFMSFTSPQWLFSPRVAC